MAGLVFSEQSNIAINRVRELVWGVTPTTPVMKATRWTGCDFELSKGTLKSNEIRPDRMTQDLRHGGRSVKGALKGHAVADDYDDLLEAAFGNLFAGNVLKIGRTKFSYSFEIGHLDQAPVIYKMHTGMIVDKFTLDAKTGAMTDMVFDFLGMDMTLPTTPADASPDPWSTNSPMDGFSGVIKKDGATAGIIQAVQLTLDNKGKLLEALGSKTAVGVSWGSAEVSGKLTAYFTSLEYLNAFLDETEVAFDFTFAGLPSNKTLKFSTPRVKFSGAKDSLDNEGALVLDMPFTALFDPTSQTSLMCTRV